MNASFVQHPPGWNGVFPPNAEELPRGVVPPPQQVLDLVARETQRFGLEIMTPEAQIRITEDFTLQYYYEGLTVAFRRTPQGVEVLAVGSDEIALLTRGLSQEALSTVHVRQP